MEERKTVLITGGSRGIGKEVAKEVRNYLIAIEDNTSIENKNIVINKMDNNIVQTDKLLTKTEVKKLINKKEYEKKKQNIEVEALLNRCLIYGLNKNESAILIQESIVNNENPEVNVLKCLQKEKDIEQIKARNAIRERLAYLARTYYKSDYSALYAVLSTRLKLSTGIDIRKIIDKQKKQYGKNSKKVQNHLDVIYENNLLEDAIIENKQAIEMSTIYRDILSSITDTYATIVSNNLNYIMKFLAGATIVLSIPTMISSFLGMNVPLGSIMTYNQAFILITVLSVVLSIVVAIILKKKNML